MDEKEEKTMITAVVVEPDKEARITEIEAGLSGLQSLVGGWIEAVYPFEDPVAIVCNEEGKLDGLPLNRGLRTEDGELYDIVAGTFAVVGLDEESFGSLSQELAEKYQKHFRTPEMFYRIGDKIASAPAPGWRVGEKKDVLKDPER